MNGDNNMESFPPTFSEAEIESVKADFYRSVGAAPLSGENWADPMGEEPSGTDKFSQRQESRTVELDEAAIRRLADDFYASQEAKK